MFYWLFSPYFDSYSFFNLFRYLTFRCGGTVFTSLFIMLIFGNKFILWLKSKQLEQPIRDCLSLEHTKAKNGTPSMGGVLILFSIIVSTLLWGNLSNPFLWLVLFITVLYSVIGFFDDYKKLIHKDYRGISAKKKLILQFLAALIFAILLFNIVSFDSYSQIYIPYIKDVFINLGWLYFLFIMIIMVGSSNAVNLTDGLDGLAIMPIMIAITTFSIISYLVGNVVYAEYLQLNYVPGAGELTIICSAFIGAGLGFLWFNAPPAKVFMGDTGSLASGASLGAISIIVKHELVLVIVGGVFVMEALSVILQVYSYKFTGKRIFQMAPIHHHFERKGWAESTIVIRFWIIALILAIVGLSTLKIR